MAPDELDEALGTIEIYYDEHSEIMFNIVALGTRGRVRVRRGELELAERDIERGESLIREAGRVPPLHASYVRSARFLLEVHRAENDAAGGEPPSRAVLRRLRASRREALRVSAWVPWRRSEALRLAGREAWLRGRPGAALKWWQRALDCASSLGALPELARTYADAGHSMSRSARPLELNGRDARRCVEEASRIFAEIGMRPELDTRAEVA